MRWVGIEHFKYYQVAILSPVQWNPNLCNPKVEALLIIKGLYPLLFKNKLVAYVCRNALKTCTLAYVILP